MGAVAAAEAGVETGVEGVAGQAEAVLDAEAAVASSLECNPVMIMKSPPDYLLPLLDFSCVIKGCTGWGGILSKKQGGLESWSKIEIGSTLVNQVREAGDMVGV